MARQHLEFEKPVIELEEQVLQARAAFEAGDAEMAKETKRLEDKLKRTYDKIFSKLRPYERVQLARLADRPQTLDYIEILIEGFIELHGDRHYADDAAIVGGVGKFGGKPVMVVGQQRGSTTQERIKRNFGQASPEGNRKAQRLFAMAEKFSLPVILFIDTQGAYPGLEAEERGQAEAIARNLQVLAGLRTPVISVVIGEGGSGGALALGVCDRLLMLEFSVYSVISPEGCAAILWGKDDPQKAHAYAATAAEVLKITASDLLQFGIVDEVIKEPPGGAHRDRRRACELAGKAISRHLRELEKMPQDEMLRKRYEKFRRIGEVKK